MFTGSIFLNLQKVLLCMAPNLQHQTKVPNENSSRIESIGNEQIGACLTMKNVGPGDEDIQIDCYF